METIELNIWEPVPNEPGHVRIADQRTAQEVFAELKHRLESIGYLPDEYFLLGDEWENGRKIPEGADIFCTADYGGSEGIYLDIYLKWHEDNKSLTKSFVTGKTLEETPIALDRMHLVASEVMKAFHGDGSIHARYMRIGGSAVPAGAVFHLNPQEHRLMVDSLVEHRNRIKDEFEGVEHLLRRVTGSITEFVNEVGERPLKISDFDRTMLSIQDGNLSEFRIPDTITSEETGELLIHAAGRPGNVGKKMTTIMLADVENISGEQYLEACKNAVNTGDKERVLLMREQAEHCSQGLDASFYGDVISYAYNENKHIADSVIKECTPEQIATAPPFLLYQAAMKGDFSTMSTLVEKGIDVNTYADQIINALTANRTEWMLERLAEKGMKMDRYDEIIEQRSEASGMEMQ